MKIGVFGGSFNPCHLMHQEIVLKLLERNILDRIIILPTGNFYKKNNLLKGEERKKMLEIMFANQQRVIICDYEFSNNLICTYRSLDYLQNLYKGDTLYFILGSDNLLYFDTWKRYEYILEKYHLLIIERKNINVQSVLEKYKPYQEHIEWISMDIEGINSTEIRKYLYSENYDAVNKMLDPNVLAYIKERRLYSEHYQEHTPIQYETDEEFLKHYNSDDYEKMSITTDITLFSISDIEKESYRKQNQKSFGVLLVKRKTAPFIHKWCLPGGFLSLDEKLLDCAKRILFVEANIDKVYLKQLHAFSDIERDIRGRVVSVSYVGLIDQQKIVSQLKDNAFFFQIDTKVEKDQVTFIFKNQDTQFQCVVQKNVDEYGNVTYKELENQSIAFDHLQMIALAIDYLKQNITTTDWVFHLLPLEFTLKELQLVYEAILGKKLIDSVFRRNIKDKVIKTDKVRYDGGHRPATLYRYQGFIHQD